MGAVRSSGGSSSSSSTSSNIVVVIRVIRVIRLIREKRKSINNVHKANKEEWQSLNVYATTVQVGNERVDSRLHSGLFPKVKISQDKGNPKSGLNDIPYYTKKVDSTPHCSRVVPPPQY